jgi:hypothetical protein
MLAEASGWRQALPIVRVFADRRGASLRGDVIGRHQRLHRDDPVGRRLRRPRRLPPAHGLYAALAGMLGYAAFASSRQVIAGPDAAITLLVASVVGPLAGGDPARTAVLCAATALIGGTIMLVAARLRLGMIADFLSKPVLVGYMTGAALILVSTQLEKLFGVKLHAHDFFPLLTELAGKLSETHRLTFALGIGCLALLGVLHRPRAPAARARWWSSRSPSPCRRSSVSRPSASGSSATCRADCRTRCSPSSRAPTCATFFPERSASRC